MPQVSHLRPGILLEKANQVPCYNPRFEPSFYSPTFYNKLRCINTVSSHRPNLNPTSFSNPAS